MAVHHITDNSKKTANRFTTDHFIRLLQQLQCSDQAAIEIVADSHTICNSVTNTACTTVRHDRKYLLLLQTKSYEKYAYLHNIQHFFFVSVHCTQSDDAFTSNSSQCRLP